MLNRLAEMRLSIAGVAGRAAVITNAHGNIFT